MKLYEPSKGSKYDLVPKQPIPVITKEKGVNFSKPETLLPIVICDLTGVTLTIK